MNAWVFGVFDMAIVGVPAIGFAVWQLVSLNREQKRDRVAQDESPEGAGHAVGEHRLDDR